MTDASTIKNKTDPGWNDPPVFAYTAGTQSTPAVTKPKLNLNKRIAFPLQSNSSGTNSAIPSVPTKVETSSGGLPMPFARVPFVPSTTVTELADNIAAIPSPSSVAPPPLLPPLSTSPASSNDWSPAERVEVKPCSPQPNITSEEALEYINGIFMTTLNSSFKDDHSKSDVVQKRLDTMRTMWLEQKFNNTIQETLYNIAKALENDKISLANDLHRSLVVNHGTVCFQWGSALRQLILFKEQSLEPQKVETELCMASNYLDPTIEIGTNESECELSQHHHNHKSNESCSTKGKTSAGRIQHL